MPCCLSVLPIMGRGFLKFCPCLENSRYFVKKGSRQGFLTKQSEFLSRFLDKDCREGSFPTLYGHLASLAVMLK